MLPLDRPDVFHCIPTGSGGSSSVAKLPDMLGAVTNVNV